MIKIIKLYFVPLIKVCFRKRNYDFVRIHLKMLFLWIESTGFHYAITQLICKCVACTCSYFLGTSYCALKIIFRKFLLFLWPAYERTQILTRSCPHVFNIAQRISSLTMHICDVAFIPGISHTKLSRNTIPHLRSTH